MAYSTSSPPDAATLNAFGYYRGHSSWARHARAFFGALHLRRPLRMVPLDRAPDPAPGRGPARPGCEGEPELDCSLPGIGIGAVEAMRYLRASFRIAVVVWETTALPRDKRFILESMDHIWTPSQWGKRLLVENGLRPEQVFVVPEGVDTNLFYPADAAEEEARSSRPFRFLCVGKWEARKGIEDLIRSFAEEFREDEEVELILHCSNLMMPWLNLEYEIRRVLAGRPARVRVSHPVPEGSLRDLYIGCDAFVLPTRAEGWGLPITEAMACGLPVIVTNYSAPADLLNEEIAYPLRVSRLVAVQDPQTFPAGGANGMWAQPDLEHLRWLMRRVFEHRDEAAARGRRARAAMCSQWTWDHAAQTACAVLGQDLKP